MVYTGTQVTYDMYELNEYMTITDISTSVMPGRTVKHRGLERSPYMKTEYSVEGQQKITIEGVIKHNVHDARETLARILYTRQDRPLIIGDQPERFLMCQLQGESGLTSRFIASNVKLTFISPNSYWESMDGFKKQLFDQEGRVLALNAGSAPTQPVVKVNFTSDCGYLGLVGPNGFITLGNAQEIDTIEVPPSEFAMNEELANLNTWTRVADLQTLIPDYNKLTSLGTAKHDQWGMQLNTSTLGTSDQWHGHGYMRNFDQGIAEREADNFTLRSRVDIADLSGRRNNTMAMLIVVMSEDNRPLMTTSIYDVSGDRNELVVTFKVPSTEPGKQKHSKIIHTGKMSNLNGFVQMEKIGNKFSWIVHNNATTSATTETRTLKVGDVVKLKSTARTIYHWDGRALPLDQSIIGQELVVKAIRNSPKGKYQLNNKRYDYVEGFFEPDAIVQTAVPKITETQPAQIKHTITDSNLAQLRPYKVVIWQAKWGATQPYSTFSINSMVVNRKYSVNSMDLVNTFMAGDELIIDNKAGEVLLNNLPFSGFMDYDSRYFDIDGGVSELALVKSQWATMPSAEIYIEDRWF